ncbi:MAG TPA: SGNH/GDSL hydrolase family protein [Isosphaeraceae bacterium]
MATRNFSRRLEFDSLEGRVVLSKGLGVVGALGDSYTDEYQFYPPNQTHARGWVEILAHTQKANFGAFQLASRGEPRNQGYANDWARFGATSDEMLAQQLPGLTSQVAAGRIKYASIFIGGNDFLYYLQAAASNLPSPAVAAQQIAGIEANAQKNLDTAVVTLLSANPQTKLVVTTVPGLAALPIVRALATTPQAQALVAGADAALEVYNANIRLIAATQPRVALADLALESSALATAGPTASFGGTTISLTTASDNYHSFFLADGLHVGTVGQGIIANTIVAALDAKFGAGVNVFTPGGIVGLARQVQFNTRNLP